MYMYIYTVKVHKPLKVTKPVLTTSFPTTHILGSI